MISVGVCQLGVFVGNVREQTGEKGSSKSSSSEKSSIGLRSLCVRDCDCDCDSDCVRERDCDLDRDWDWDWDLDCD